MLTRKQLKIFGILGRNIFKEYTFKEIKQLSREKSNSVLQNAFKQFLKERLIIQRKIGTSKLYRINHENSKAYNYISLYSYEKHSKTVRQTIEIIKREIKETFYSLVIFGSYAKSLASKKSDLDIAVFVKNKIEKKRVKIALNSASNKTPLDIDYHIITEKEFQEMLKANYENLGKEIARTNSPICNPEIFYNLLRSAIKNESNTFY